MTESGGLVHVLRNVAPAGLLIAVLAACGSAPPPTATLASSPSSHPTAPSLAPTAPSLAPTATAVTSALPSPTQTAAAANFPTLPPASAPVGPSASPASTGPTIDQADVERHLDALQRIADENAGIRAAGTAGYDASVEYVAEQLTSLGFSVEEPAVAFTTFDESAPVELTIGDQSWSGGEWLHAMLYSPAGTISGQAQAVGGAGGLGACDAQAWSEFQAGHIAVVPPSPCGRRQQVLLAQAHGAVGFIGAYQTWQANQIKRPTLIDPAGLSIPVVGAGAEPALALLQAASTGAEVHLEVQVTMSAATLHNVIAELPGATADVVMLGAHLDSVLDGPGMNDNGSGVASLLALAESVAALPVAQKTIRFGFWAAEEFGEIGSTTYVDSLSAPDHERINAYLNLDMVGSVGGTRMVYDEELAPDGSAQITQLLTDALAEAGTPGTATDLGGASDHAQFQRVGIPTGGVFSGLDACYHLACDSRANIDMTMLMSLAGATASALESLAY